MGEKDAGGCDTGRTLGGSESDPQSRSRPHQNLRDSRGDVTSNGHVFAAISQFGFEGCREIYNINQDALSGDNNENKSVLGEWAEDHRNRSSPEMVVELIEEIDTPLDTTLANNSSTDLMSEEQVVIVRAEEVLLVVLVLILWVAAIALFFNRWGKIRMLEPYQPKFQQSHRPSCPLAPLSPPHITPQQRMSFSKYNVNCFADTYSGLPSPNPTRRPRLNSVFVGSSTMAFMNPPRRAKSAMDIQHMVLNEKSPTSLTGYSSMLPIINYRERKPSITIERAYCHAKHRPSIPTERPMLSHYQQFRNRRSSCAVDTSHRHRNFHSFEQPRRKASITIERPSYSYQGPTISFETSTGPTDRPTLLIERHEKPKTSRSFEQPMADRTQLLPRMAASLDVNTMNFDRRPSIPEEEGRTSPVVITFDESEVTANAPLLERLKSSDV